MLWQVTTHLPTREAYVEMLGRARAATADALNDARKAGNLALSLRYQVQLADWDRLIKRVTDDNPFA